MDTNGSNKEENSRLVDIGTKEGANAFLEQVHNFDFFSSNLKKIRVLRKKKRLNSGDEIMLETLYGYINCLAANADAKIFHAKIPQSEIQVSLDYAIEEIQSFTAKRNWISTGRLDHIDRKVLQFCVFMLNGHVVPVYLAFESKFFQVLANFIEARKAHGGRALPHVDICVHIGRIVYATIVTANKNFDNPWSLEKIFKKLEGSGILEQILRCGTVPELVGSGSVKRLEARGFVYEFLKLLESCPSILTRKFKSGEPCGDTLKAILDGRDGSRSIQPRILNRLQGIARLMETMGAPELKVDMCNYCCKNGDAEAPLSVCSRCSLACYCSKECQKAHWKIHKLSCRKMHKAERDRDTTLKMAMNKFFEQNTDTFFQTMAEMCNSTGVKESDLAIEVDFMPNEDGIIPAFHDPPIFRIVLVRDYISGQETPEWLLGDKISDEHREWFEDRIKEEMPKVRSTFAMVIHHGGHECIRVVRDWRSLPVPNVCRSVTKTE